jgi:signal transduction histidine kinase
VTVSTIAVPIAFAAGLHRARSARGAVADLVVELDRAPEPPRLRDVIARALGDPSLEIAYPAPDAGGWVGAAGLPVTLPGPADPSRAVTRLERDGRTVAALIHDPAIAEERELVASVSAATSLALENERLQAEVRAQLEEVRASRARIVAAGDAERRRIERDLHDGAQQRLVTLALILEMAQQQAGGAPELEGLIEKARRELEDGLTELRELARGLHPVALDEGLAGAVDSLAERVSVPVEVVVPPERHRPEVEATAYFVIAEALTNVVRYADASRARVAVTRSGHTLVVEVADDGVGGADPARGSGLRGLADRVATAGGRLTLTSPTGHGTILRAEIPCE